MKKFRFLSWLLCLSMLFATLTVPGTAAVAEETSNDDKSGMVFTKKAEKTGDKEYTITLEAYATGEKVISEVTKDVPTDIILVLDQSGSMAEDIGTVSFEQYKDETDWWGSITAYHTRNQDYYEYRHNGGSSNLWHKLADDSYVSVSVTWKEDYGYTSIDNGKNNSTQSGATNYYNNQNNLYALVNREYQKVTVKQSGSRNNRIYTYTLPDGTQIANSRGNNTSPSFSNIDGTVLYLRGIVRTYTYTYTDSNNNVQTIGTSPGATTVFSPALYERITSASGGGTRLDALKNAVNSFASAVHTKSLGKDGKVGGDDDIDHRIALVGFSSPDYNNTELLTGSTINQGSWKGTDIGNNNYTGYYYFPTGYEMNGPQYESITDAQYKAALLSMNTDAGLSGVASGVNALTALGGTRTDNGLAMANKIFEQNPIPAEEKRNRVVIVFTDGIPGQSGYDSTVATSAINEASTAKNTYGATVYTIGVFPGADATQAGSTENRSTDADKGNYFLQRVSSNTQYPHSPSYYLSAADSASLNSIFKQISSNIETGGSSSTLTKDAVVKDVISQYFTLPEGANEKSIKLETYACTGKNGDEYTWRKNDTAMGAEASISEDGQEVSVTGFNFSDNYVGTVIQNNQVTGYRGNKLVISFTVKPKAGFLGGNDVPTNGEESGIYKNDTADKPDWKFEVPTVNVPIDDVTVTAQDKNVYLWGSLTANDLENGATVTVGGVPLDLSKANDTEKPYGLETWQTEFVNITVAVKDKNGTAIPTDGLKALTDDTTYTISVTVAPKQTNPTSTQGALATQKEGSGTGKINVFTPELTFKDSRVNYKSTLVTLNENGYADNLQKTEWKHGETVDSSVTMIGTVPTLTKTYAPTAGVDSNKIVIATGYVPVQVTVKIGETLVTGHTTFVHQACEDTACQWKNVKNADDLSNPAFLLHVINVVGDLTITKTGLNVNVYGDGKDQESAIFEVSGDGKTWTVAINGDSSVTLTGLKVGKYTVRELTDWTWRYDSSTLTSDSATANANGSITVTVTGGDGAVTTVRCENDSHNDKWLGGDNYKNNVFASSSAAAAD